MRITSTFLTRGAAVAAAISGLAYIAVQFIHPADVVESLSTQAWVNVHLLSFAQAMLALIGVTGLYLHQAQRVGLVGLIGYAMFGFFFVLQAAFTFAEALIAPLVAAAAPQLAVDLVGLFGRTPAETDLSGLAALPNVGAVLYIVGALIVGIVTLRARMLSRGASILLIAAAAATPIAGALLPHALERMAAIPMGLALIWLGYSLWSGSTDDPHRTPTATDSSRIATS